MDYKSIIEYHVKKAIDKKEKDKDNKEHWDWVLLNLYSDLKNMESGERWNIEPRDEAWNKYRRQDPMAHFKKIWKEMTGEDLPF